MHPYQVNVSSRYGAPMGRRSNSIPELRGKVRACRVPLDSGGYDPGGAYWGGGSPLFCAWDGEDRVCYGRAADRTEYKARLARLNSAITFYR